MHTRLERLYATLLFFAVVSLVPSTARSLDAFEIQVYQADVNRPWQAGLELHSNYTLRGHDRGEYAGQIPADRTARFTLEPALGITEWFEAGAYLQTMVSPEGARFGGFKVRGKFVVPTRLTAPFFFGMNVEVGRVPRAVEEEGWANEFRPIIGWTNGRLLLDVNPIVGYALSGPEKLRPHLEPAGKIGVNTDLGFMLGAEYYAGLGLIDAGFSPLRGQEHIAFLTFDLASPVGHPEPDDQWELNVAFGRSLTDATPSQWQIKTIVGRAF